MADINAVVGLDESDPGGILLENGNGQGKGLAKENPGRLKKQEKNSSPGDDFLTATGDAVIPAGGRLERTEAADTLAATGTLPIVGELEQAEAADSLAATATLPIVGDVAVDEDADTLAGTGTLPIAAALDATEDSDTAAAEGDGAIVSEADLAEAADELAATGTLPIAASLDAGDADDALSATALLGIEGVLGVVHLLKEDGDHLIAEDGCFLVVDGGAVVEEDDTLAAVGADLGNERTAELDVTEGDDALASTATVSQPDRPSQGGGGWSLDQRWRPRRQPLPPIVGRLRVVEDDDTLAASAALGPNPVLMDNDLLLFAAAA